MASPKKNQPESDVEVGKTAAKRAKKKSEPKAPEPAPAKPVTKLSAKSERILRQEEAARRNKELRAQGKPTPWEEKREARRKRRAKDPIVVGRRKRRESEQMAAERARRLKEAEAAEKAATPAIAKVHASV